MGCPFIWFGPCMSSPVFQQWIECLHVVPAETPGDTQNNQAPPFTPPPPSYRKRQRYLLQNTTHLHHTSQFQKRYIHTIAGTISIIYRTGFKKESTQLVGFRQRHHTPLPRLDLPTPRDCCVRFHAGTPVLAGGDSLRALMVCFHCF